MENEVKIADYIQRMIDEKKELNERITKLTAFRFSAKGEALDDRQRELMDEQAYAMKHYSDLLFRRIINEKIKTSVIPDSDAPSMIGAPEMTR